MKPITAPEAIKKMNCYKKEVAEYRLALTKLNIKLRKKNAEIADLKNKLVIEYPNLEKKFKKQQKLLQTSWIMHYLEGE